ncbi:MAG TPA: serine/threonine-protein kinase [Polyangiaceae bacterium]|nr:serine/threonine-protein kinase [Polyangiaceae bacterium]
MRSEAIRPGDVIAGKYRVRAILGRSRGFLVEAFHTEFDQRVVIRVLSPALVDEKEIERFRREARTLAKLESEHVARIIDVGTQPDGAFYLVRQYLEGIDFATHLKQVGRLPLQQAVLFILQVSEVLAQTHVHNIILRELQPSHLFLAQRMGGAPVLKVIDFGTAKLMREAAAPTAGGEMTATAMFGMSPFSSPELVRKAKNVDARTDVWSLGAILYQMLAGRPPFEGEMAMLMLQIMKEDPPPLTSLRPDLPPELNNIIGWSLAKDVDGRFANVHAFAHALTPYASPEGQVLIQRIGEITHAAKQQKPRPAYAAPPPAAAAPLPAAGRAMPHGDVDDDAPTYVEALDEDNTGVKPTPAKGGQPANDSPLERTMFMGADYVAPSPGPPGMQRPGASPAAAAQQPGPVFGGATSGPSGPPGQGSVPPGKASLLGPPLQLEGGGRRQAMQSWNDLGGAAGAGAAGAQGAGAGAAGARPGLPATNVSATAMSGASDVAWQQKKSGNRNTLLLGVAGAVIGLSLLTGILVFFSGGGSETPSTASTDTAIAVPPPTAAPADTGAAAPPPEPPQQAAGTPTSTPSPPAQPTAVAGGQQPSQPPAPNVGPTTPPKTTSSPPSGPIIPPPKPTVTSAPAPTSSPPPPSGGDGMGTLVAVAVGGSCTFSVNGASKGSGATIKVQLKAGTYSVSCKPVSGATKSRSVTVSSGQTAMAMFKL